MDKAIIWDVDDVLTPTSMAFYNSVCRTHGRCSHPDQWEDYWWGRHIGTGEGSEVHLYLTLNSVIENTQPFPYTRRALQLTHNAGYKNLLLSARSWHDSPGATTRTWSVSHSLDPFINGMYFVQVEESKCDRICALSAEYDIVAFVDDNPFHALSAVGIVPNIYLMNRSWNKGHHNDDQFHHVSTALQAAQHIVNMPQGDL